MGGIERHFMFVFLNTAGLVGFVLVFRINNISQVYDILFIFTEIN